MKKYFLKSLATAIVPFGGKIVDEVYESQERKKEALRQEGRNEAKAEYNKKLERLREEIEKNSSYKSAQERDKVAIHMCGVAIAFAKTGGAITKNEKHVIETVICGKVGMTSTVRTKIDSFYRNVPGFEYMLKQASNSKLVNMKNIEEILILLDRIEPEKSGNIRKNYLYLASIA